MSDSTHPATDGNYVEPELDDLGVDRVEVVTAYSGLLTIFCARAQGEWAMVALWDGHEHVLFEAAGSAN